jgi:hypothetical protein
MLAVATSLIAHAMGRSPIVLEQRGDNSRP